MGDRNSTQVAVESRGEIPASILLEGNYPNPFTTSTSIAISRILPHDISSSNTPIINTRNSMFSQALVAASLQPIALTILSRQEAYGYDIMQRVEELSDGKMAWTAGTLYPLLHRLEAKGLITAIWRPSTSGPRRKYYRITAKGERALADEKRQWLDVHAMLVKLWGSELSFA